MMESVEEFGNRWRFRALEAELEIKRLRAELASARATVLREAADAVSAMDFSQLRADFWFNSQRNAWDCGQSDAADLLRRRADGVCNCVHPTDEHSVYGCADGCPCEYLPNRKPVPPTTPAR